MNERRCESLKSYFISTLNAGNVTSIRDGELEDVGLLTVQANYI